MLYFTRPGHGADPDQRRCEQSHFLCVCRCSYQEPGSLTRGHTSHLSPKLRAFWRFGCMLRGAQDRGQPQMNFIPCFLSLPVLPRRRCPGAWIGDAPRLVTLQSDSTARGTREDRAAGRGDAVALSGSPGDAGQCLPSCQHVLGKACSLCQGLRQGSVLAAQGTGALLWRLSRHGVRLPSHAAQRNVGILQSAS